MVICDTLRADGGEISVKTNTDTSKCNLRVAFANKFITGMPAKATVVEREPFTATVEVKVENEKSTSIANLLIVLNSYGMILACSRTQYSKQFLNFL